MVYKRYREIRSGYWMGHAIFRWSLSEKKLGKDRKKIEGTFKKFFDHNIPIWLVLFPEGTRFRPEKLKLMARIARSKKLPPLNHVLLPRAKGFVASVQGLKGHCKAVYDATIIYEGKAPTIADLVLGRVNKVKLHVKRFELDTLADNEKTLTIG